MRTCPSEDQWLSFLGGATAAEETTSLEAHLDECIDCRELTAAIVRARSITQSTATAPAVPASNPTLTGAVIGRYYLLERLGEGGMGIVYAAYDPKLDRRVAVKLLKNGWRADQHEENQRIGHEARALAKISHPNVITVHDTGEFDGQRFITMELVDGPSLHTYARSRSWQELLPLLLQAGEGLAAAHRAGLVHRDFKPDNVLVSSRGVALVTDFGLAHPVDEAQQPALAGTLSYMAPEQRAGQPTTPLSDQFSFCMTGLQLLPEAPRAVLELLEKGSSPDPPQRFASMAELVAELKAVPGRRRRRAVRMAVAVTTVLIVSGAVGARSLTATRCEAASAAISDSWNDGARERIRAAFLKTSMPDARNAFERLEARLDAYASEWQLKQGAACRARPAWQPPAAIDRCLEHANVSFAALVNVLSEADAAMVRRGVASTGALPTLSKCWGPNADELGDDDAALKTYAHWLAIREAGHHQQAATGLQALRDTLPPQHAMRPVVDLALLETRLRADDFDAAEPLLLQTLATATEASRDELIVLATTTYAHSLVRRGVRLDEAERWLMLGDAALMRIGRPLPELRAGSEEIRGLLALSRAQPQRAEEHLRRALADAELSLGPDDLTVAELLGDLTGALRDQPGKTDEVRALSDRELDLIRKARGPSHPDLMTPLANRITFFMNNGQFAEARETAKELLRVTQTAAVPRTLTLARILRIIADSALTTDGAVDPHVVEEASDALSILEEVLGPASLETLSAHVGLAAAYLAVENHEQALVHCRIAENGLRASVEPAPPFLVSNAAGCTGESLRNLGRNKEAVPALERALEATKKWAPGMPVQQAQIEFGLAQAQTIAFGPSPQATARAKSALRLFDELKIDEEREKVAMWLKSLEKPARH